MHENFLKRVFYATASEKAVPVRGKRLEEIYKRIPETRETFDKLNAQLNALGIEVESIDQKLFSLTEAHEMQGFLNGFRLGEMLYRELHGRTRLTPTIALCRLESRHSAREEGGQSKDPPKKKTAQRGRQGVKQDIRR